MQHIVLTDREEWGRGCVSKYFLTHSCELLWIFDPFSHSLYKSIFMFCVYGNILGDLGSKSSVVSGPVSNSRKVTFSFEALWEGHNHGHFYPVLFAVLVYLESGTDFKRYSDSWSCNQCSWQPHQSLHFALENNSKYLSASGACRSSLDLALCSGTLSAHQCVCCLIHRWWYFTVWYWNKTYSGKEPQISVEFNLVFPDSFSTSTATAKPHNSRCIKKAEEAFLHGDSE